MRLHPVRRGNLSSKYACICPCDQNFGVRSQRWESTVSPRDQPYIPTNGLCRRDQLVLEDDPAFLPDFALPGLDIDLAALDISTDDSSRRSSILSPHSLLSSQSSHAGADESMLGLIIPTSDTGGAGDLGGFVLPEASFSSAQRRANFGRLLDDEDEGFNVDPGFTFDAEGNLIEDRPPGHGQDVAPTGAIRLGSDFAADGNMQRGLLEDSQAGPYEVSLFMKTSDRMNDDLYLARAYGSRS